MIKKIIKTIFSILIKLFFFANLFFFWCNLINLFIQDFWNIWISLICTAVSLTIHIFFVKKQIKEDSKTIKDFRKEKLKKLQKIEI